MRTASLPFSATYIGRDGPKVTLPHLQAGDSVYVKGDRSKSKARDPYKVISVDNDKQLATVQKFAQSHNKRNILDVKLSELYLTSRLSSSQHHDPTLDVPTQTPVPEELPVQSDTTPTPPLSPTYSIPNVSTTPPTSPHCFFCGQYNRPSGHSPKSCRFLLSVNPHYSQRHQSSPSVSSDASSITSPPSVYLDNSNSAYSNESDMEHYTTPERDMDDYTTPECDMENYNTPSPDMLNDYNQHPPGIRLPVMDNQDTNNHHSPPQVVHNIHMEQQVQQPPVLPTDHPPSLDHVHVPLPPDPVYDQPPLPVLRLARPRPGNNIRIYDIDHHTQVHAMVSPMTRKCRNKHPLWANIKIEGDTNVTSFNFSLLRWEYIDPSNVL